MKIKDQAFEDRFEKIKKMVEMSEQQLAGVKGWLYEMETHPCNHWYDDLDEAEDAIEWFLRGQAKADCEGSYNFGMDEYTQEFIVGDTLYEGKLAVEYNRHDKEYYYPDITRWSCVEMGPYKGEA